MWSSFSHSPVPPGGDPGTSGNVDHTLTRRTVLTAGAALAAAAMPPSAQPTRDWGVALPAGGNVRPVSMAMHIHGPFSEGLASFSALAKGAAWFTDLARYRGSLDLRIAAERGQGGGGCRRGR
jgi:hypothetical protein